MLGYHTVKLEKTNKDENMRPSYTQDLEQYLDAEFINEHLSIGFCTIKRFNSCMITFKGNTSEGSSGSPILDQSL